MSKNNALEKVYIENEDEYYTDNNGIVFDKYGLSLIHRAASEGNTELIEKLYNQNKEVLNLYTNEKKDALTPLVIAIIHQQHSSVEKLLSLGANPYLKVGGLAPFVYAMCSTTEPTIFCKSLINHGVETSVLGSMVNKYGKEMLGQLGVLDKNIDEIANIICKTEEETNDDDYYIKDNVGTLVENKAPEKKKENSDNSSYDAGNSDEIDSVDVTGEESNNNDF